MLQLVDAAGHLKPQKEILGFLNSIFSTDVTSSDKCKDPLNSVGSNYHVVGVLGAQSSGKSTLLNHLFGTNFQMLDETVRRGQTTKGVFLSRANVTLRDTCGQTKTASSPLLIVDFEGTDGFEHGEDQSFERQLSLFALCMADALIINMWAVDVGRFNAANLNLLRTIFEVNLQLFSHDAYEKEEKPMLLIVLRDFTEGDLGPSLAALHTSFDTIWENVVKPPRFAKSSITDLFKFKYFSLPHFKLQREEFMSGAAALQHWFSKPQNENFVFGQLSMFRGVPLEDLPSYLSSCWDTIRASKDLDIPTQREMLAHHRCKDAKASAFSTFRTFCQDCEQHMHRGDALLPLSGRLEEMMMRSVSEYTRQTKLYRSEVVTSYQEELEEEMEKLAMEAMNGACAPVVSDVLNGIENQVQNVVDDGVRQLLRSAQALPFIAAAAGPTTDSKPAGALEPPLPFGVASDTFRINGAACRGLVLTFWGTLVNEVNQLLAVVAGSPPPAHIFDRHVTAIGHDPVAQAHVANLVAKALFNKLIFRIASMNANASETAHRGFARCLSHNADGTVRFFSTTKGFMQAVPSAQQAGLIELGNFLYFRALLSAAAQEDANVEPTCTTATHPAPGLFLRRVKAERRILSVRQNHDEERFFLEYTTLDKCPQYPRHVPIAQTPMETNSSTTSDLGVAASCVLLSETALERAFESFKQKCEFTVQLELRSIEAGRHRLPAWVIPAILILGFNEFWYILTSPILLPIFIFVVFFFFKGFVLDQWRFLKETGPSVVVIPLDALVKSLALVYHGIFPNLNAPSKPAVSVVLTNCDAHTSSHQINDDKATSLSAVPPQLRSSGPAHADPTSASTMIGDSDVGTALRKRGNQHAA